MNINDFYNDIINSLSNCNLNLDYFNSFILNLLDIYSPIRRCLVTIHDNFPWFNSELHKIKRNSQKLENLYKIKSVNETYSTFVNYMYFYRSSIIIAKKNYYYYTFSSFENNTRNMYYFINTLTKTESVICPTLSNLILCSNFSIFCQDKVSNIISKIKLITNNVYFIPLCYDILLGCVYIFTLFLLLL